MKVLVDSRDSADQALLVELSRQHSTEKISEHTSLSRELAAIQKELELRVSLAKRRDGGSPWTKPNSS